MSFSICNLPPEYRYRTSNLLCTGILPGPKEQTGDQVQRYLRPVISDLLRLWRDGIMIPTESCPQGRLVRVVLVAAVCDKPAAHKIGGFGAHTHGKPCSMCWITQTDIKENLAFPSRTNDRHRELGEQYRQLKTKGARHAFVQAHSTRYTQLSRLPYFDIVNQVVIDPMHNLFLGAYRVNC
ncbi:hypothetical protein CONPUDRAFT_45752 [Coniophora puteana RWD-64-598 SS2]|uniref:Uncharacterized protein n=1 Tax=Coniophora puteana (strain RWD-64-598) TaxID=741705 RepID=A0A5M3N694_CONPW|nr:uncharacterized protein CONPUDRAFT_45752 [Coniophora puteana RWD-64-598 SS2]EIW86727.1 hypothetical protein CONPUDRAFT_45752 [Coniophora puteana RWD-64-598 SS2]